MSQKPGQQANRNQSQSEPAQSQNRGKADVGKGLYHRSKRPVEVEAVFGQMKSNNRFTRFTLRGLEKIAIEFGLMALGHNLRKWAKRRLSVQSNLQNLTSVPQKQAAILISSKYPDYFNIAA